MIRQAPTDVGRLDLIVQRPAAGTREVLEGGGQLDVDLGLVGDRWNSRASRRPDSEPLRRDRQLTVMGTRVIALLAGTRANWAQSGDQLIVDLDLSLINLPAGTRLAIGEAVIEVTAVPHTGCGKFRSRYGADAVHFVNSPEGRNLNLRGINARVVRSGRIRAGDDVRKLSAAGV